MSDDLKPGWLKRQAESDSLNVCPTCGNRYEAAKSAEHPDNSIAARIAFGKVHTEQPVTITNPDGDWYSNSRKCSDQPVECSVCRGNKAVNGTFDLSGNFEGEDNCPACTVSDNSTIQPHGHSDHETWFCREYKTPHSGFGVKEYVVNASKKAWQAQEVRIIECKRQADELLNARNRTVRFLEDEIDQLKAPKRESSEQQIVMNTALGVILNHRCHMPKHIVRWAESKVDLSDAEIINFVEDRETK